MLFSHAASDPYTHACRPMDPAKGRRFFTVLRDSIIKLWMQDERLHASDLVQMVKEEYLVS